MRKRYYSFEEVGPTITVQLKNIVKVTAGKASNGWSCDPYYAEVGITCINCHWCINNCDLPLAYVEP